MSNTFELLKGGGKMGELIRAEDWSQTSLGAPETWSDSLISAVNISLNSGFPIAIYWGNDFTLLYNDSWSSIPGDKHPWALGKPGAVVWPEIWEGLKDEFESVLHKGESYRRPDALLLMQRYGYTEECYFDYSLSPVVAADGTVGGVFNAVIETTYKFINERRGKLLYQFLQQANIEQNIAQAVQRAMSILKTGIDDIPFCMLYQGINDSNKNAGLTAYLGLNAEQAAELDASLKDIASTDQSVFIKNLDDHLQLPLISIWPETVKEAVIVPITKDDARVKGYVVLGASPRKRIDEVYMQFLKSVGMHIGSLLSNGYSSEVSLAFKREQELNEELASSNEEILSINEDLKQTQESLNMLNTQLEARVRDKTSEVIAAQLEVSLERDRLKNFFLQTPAGICILDGDDFVFELVNDHYQQLFSGRQLLGKPILQALPEIKDQPIWDILNEVYTTGKVYEGNELHVPLAFSQGGKIEDRYFNFIYQPRHNNSGAIDGILVFVFEVTDTVKSKIRIKESESNLRNLVMTSHYPLMILRGYNFIVEIANQEIAKLWGKNLDQIIGRDLLEILPELEGQPFPALLKEVMDTGMPYGQEEEVFYVNTDEGLQAKYISFYYDPIKDDNGTASGIIVTANDITSVVTARMLLQESNEEQQTLNEEISATNEELAAANEELITTNDELYLTQKNLEKLITDLAESESRFRLLIQDAPVAIAVFRGPELIIESANKKVLEIWGKQKDILGQKLAHTLPELKEQPFLKLLDEVFTSGKSYYGSEVKVVHYHNNQRIEAYHNFIYQPIKNTEDVTVAIMIVAIEVTEQVNARLRVEENEKRLTFMLNAIPQQVWTARPDGSLNYVNQVVCKDFGSNASDIVEHGWNKFIHPDDLQGSLRAWQKALESGKEYFTEFRLLMHTGEYRWHLSRALPYIEDGAITLWLGTNTDIQLQKNNEQKKDEFLSIASHELKTPLTSIKAFNQLMQRNNDPAKLSGFIKKSGDHIFRLEKLINDLLDVTRINAGKMTYNMEAFNFKQMLINSIEGVQHISPAHQIILESADDITYTGDQYRLEQVMHNFLTNAVKYSPDGKKVIVNSKIVADNIIVSVQDFGIGIAQEHIDKLFDRYYRVDNTAMRFEGLGLGLFISSEILKRHHGSFWIESEQDKGSTFFFRLPLNPANKIQPVAKSDTYYRDNIITINYNQTTNSLETDWTGFQDTESVMQGCMKMLEIITKNKPSKILNDNRNVQGTWSEASEWVGKEFFPMMEKAGVKYLAWIFSPSIFSQLSAQKSVDVAVGNITTQFFTEIKMAKQWLDNL